MTGEPVPNKESKVHQHTLEIHWKTTHFHVNWIFCKVFYINCGCKQENTKWIRISGVRSQAERLEPLLHWPHNYMPGALPTELRTEIWACRYVTCSRHPITCRAPWGSVTWFASSEPLNITMYTVSIHAIQGGEANSDYLRLLLSPFKY